MRARLHDVRSARRGRQPDQRVAEHVGVVIELKKVTHGAPGVIGPNLARSGQANVVLPAPPGSRRLVDGVTNTPISPHRAGGGR